MQMHRGSGNERQRLAPRGLGWPVHLLAGVALAIFVAALYYPLLFTNRVLATGDILLYFYPYREAVAAALREGRMPFWNPYLFGGAPLLANPQAAVLYPLHWPLIWLSPTQQVYWSAGIHTWLLGAGGYWLLRRWGGNGWAGLATALVLSGSGLVGGLMGHLNQLNVAAWAAWAVICVEGVRFTAEAQRGRGGPKARGREQTDAADWPQVLLRSVALGLVVAMMLLAGHTQTVYIVLFGLGAWSLWPLVERRWRETGARLAVYAAGVLLGVLLSAPQLLPTLELSGLGLRTGGLGYQEATSFSLKPLQLLWTLLPTYGLLSLETIFDTPAYTEFVAYSGLLGLALALVGAWQGRGRARAFGLLFVLLGLALAAGRWNPLYYLLHWGVPGFDLFRVPARWMLLYTLGAAVLAGLGAQWAVQRLRNRVAGRAAAWGPAILLLLLAADLLQAARALPHTRPTAPDAVYGVRSAPAHLLTDGARAAVDPPVDPAAAGRFLGLSTITFDPGDMADYQRIMREGEPPQLSQAAFDDLVIAQKVQELLVPNLALLWRIPTIDGFDGGVLPLQRYNQLARLLIPAETFVPDGRLREQLKEIPPATLLNLMNVQYLIADKVRDLWFEDVYYDRQIGLSLHGGQEQASISAAVQTGPFEGTHLDLIAVADAPAAAWADLADRALPVAQVVVTSSNGRSDTGSSDTGESRFDLTVGGAPGAHLADGALDSPLAQASGATVAYRDVDAGRQEYRVRLPFAAPQTPLTVTLRLLDDRFALRVQAATIYDERTGMFAALLPSDRGRFSRVHSGDVKIYENLDLAPRAILVPQTLAAGDAAEAAALLQSQVASGSGAAPITVVEGLPALGAAQAGAQGGAQAGAAQIVRYGPEEVVIQTASTQPALLLLSDAFYPGWRATVDGNEAPIHPANVLFRGVPLEAGDHVVRFTYEPGGWRLGLAVAAAAGVLLIALSVLGWWGFRRQRRLAV